MDNYKDFTVEDFVMDKYFRQWAMGELPEADTFWQEFQLQNFEKIRPIEQARTIVKSLHTYHDTIDETELRQRIQAILAQIATNQTRVLPFYRQNWFKIAATIALFLTASLAVFNSKKRINTPSVSSLVLAEMTPIEAILSDTMIRFPDGSTADLKRGSTIEFDKDFTGTQRTVRLLAGEVFFEVAKNPQKPFLVYTNAFITKVLGTSFRVKAYKNDSEVSVEVKTGQVSVFTQKDAAQMADMNAPMLKGLVLTPNQKIVFNRADAQLIKTLVEQPEIIKPEGTKQTFNFDFEDTPASDVFRLLKEAYTINIVYDEAVLKDCPITAFLTDQPLYDKLKIVCAAINAKYEILDGQIIILSKGCKN